MHLDVTAFRSFFLLRAFDGMLTASPGRQRQRHRTGLPAPASGLPAPYASAIDPNAMWAR